MPISRFWVSRADIHTIRSKNFLTDANLKGTQEKALSKPGVYEVDLLSANYTLWFQSSVKP